MQKMWQRFLGRSSRKLPEAADVATEQDLYYCYRLFLRREPDPEGFAHFKRQIDRQRVSLSYLVDTFLNAPEFQKRSFGTMFDYVQAAARQVQRVVLSDFTIYVRTDDPFIGKPIAERHHYEPHVVQQVRRWLKPGDTFVDIGANIGYFTLLAAFLVGDEGRVFAFEPNISNCELLKLGLTDNQFHNVTLYPHAVAESEQPFLLEVNGSNGWVIPFDAPRAATRETDNPTQFLTTSVTIDHTLRDVDRVDLIKMDIEGAEYRALQGMAEVLCRFRPVLLTEFSPATIEMCSRVHPEDYLDALRAYQYELFVIEPSATLSSALSNAQIMELHVHSGKPHLDLLACPQGSI